MPAIELSSPGKAKRVIANRSVKTCAKSRIESFFFEECSGGCAIGGGVVEGGVSQVDREGQEIFLVFRAVEGPKGFQGGLDLLACGGGSVFIPIDSGDVGDQSRLSEVGSSKVGRARQPSLGQRERVEEIFDNDGGCFDAADGLKNQDAKESDSQRANRARVCLTIKSIGIHVESQGQERFEFSSRLDFFGSAIVARNQFIELDRCIRDFRKSCRIEVEAFRREREEILAREGRIEVAESEQMTQPVFAAAMSRRHPLKLLQSQERPFGQDESHRDEILSSGDVGALDLFLGNPAVVGGFEFTFEERELSHAFIEVGANPNGIEGKRCDASLGDGIGEFETDTDRLIEPVAGFGALEGGLPEFIGKSSALAILLRGQIESTQALEGPGLREVKHGGHIPAAQGSSLGSF